MGIKRQSIGFPDLRFEDERLNRLMQATRTMAAELQRLQQMLRAGTAGQVLEKSTGQDYDATWTDTGTGAITGAKNVGAGDGLFKGADGSVLEFKTLIQGDNIILTVSADAITISAVPTGGGTGTVTSVGIASDALDVVGTPVTEAGVITLTIKDNAITYSNIQQTSQDSVVLGRKVGDGAGNVEELGQADLLALLGLSISTGYPPQLAYSGIV